MSQPTEQDDRRRRRAALLWLAGTLALAVLAAAGTFAVLHRDGDPGAVEADGTGTAPVLESPPPGMLPSTTATPAATVVPDPATTSSGEDVVSGSAVGGPALVPSAGATAGFEPREHGLNLLLTSTLSAPLRPGVERVLTVSVRNPNDFAVDLYRVDVRVDAPPAAGCLAEWVDTSHYRYLGGTPKRITGRATASVNLAIELVDLADVDQNACQNTAFPLRLSGIAVVPS